MIYLRLSLAAYFSGPLCN